MVQCLFFQKNAHLAVPSSVGYTDQGLTSVGTANTMNIDRRTASASRKRKGPRKAWWTRRSTSRALSAGTAERKGTKERV